MQSECILHILTFQSFLFLTFEMLGCLVLTLLTYCVKRHQSQVVKKKSQCFCDKCLDCRRSPYFSSWVRRATEKTSRTPARGNLGKEKREKKIGFSLPKFPRAGVRDVFSAARRTQEGK